MPETVSRATVVEADVALAAFQWWMSKRPQGWTLGQHIAEPLHGCTTREEMRLAQAISDWMRGE